MSDMVVELREQIKVLQQRQTELQARNTELVEESRKRTSSYFLSDMFEGFDQDKKIVRELMGKPYGVPPSEDEVEQRVLALYIRMQAMK